MASPDVQIIRSGPAGTPLDYTLPQSAGLQPLAVNAVFDGTAAGGSFLPCVEIIGASGTVIARTAADTTVLAGGGAEVSWFPGVKSSAAASSSSTASASAFLWTQTPKTFTGTSGFSATWDHFETTDTTVFGTNPFGVTTLPPANTTGDVNLMLLQAGAYVFDGTIRFAAGTVNVYGQVQVLRADYLDDGGPTTSTDLATIVPAMSREGKLMTQSLGNVTVTPGDTPGILYLLMEGQTAISYSTIQYTMVVHYLGGGIGNEHFVY